MRFIAGPRTRVRNEVQQLVDRGFRYMLPTAHDLRIYIDLMETGKELEVLPARHRNAFPRNP